MKISTAKEWRLLRSTDTELESADLRASGVMIVPVSQLVVSVTRASSPFFVVTSWCGHKVQRTARARFRASLALSSCQARAGELHDDMDLAIAAGTPLKSVYP